MSFDAGPATPQTPTSPSPATNGGGSGSRSGSRRRSSVQKQELKSQNSDLIQENKELKMRLAQIEALMHSLGSAAGGGSVTVTNDLLAALIGNSGVGGGNTPSDPSHFSSGEEEGGVEEEEESGIDCVSGTEDHGQRSAVYTVEIQARQFDGDADGSSLVVDGVSVERKKKKRSKKNRKRAKKPKATSTTATKIHSKSRRKRKQKPRSGKGKNARKRGRSVSFMAMTELPETVVHEECIDGSAPPYDKKVEDAKVRILGDLVKRGVEVKPVSTTARVQKLLRDELAKGKKSAFYLVNLGHVVHKLFQWQRLLPRIQPHYAMKCNPDKTIVQTLQLLGIGFDCASQKELELALEVGATPEQIIFANPCK